MHKLIKLEDLIVQNKILKIRLLKRWNLGPIYILENVFYEVIFTIFLSFGYNSKWTAKSIFLCLVWKIWIDFPPYDPFNNFYFYFIFTKNLNFLFFLFSFLFFFSLLWLIVGHKWAWASLDQQAQGLTGCWRGRALRLADLGQAQPQQIWWGGALSEASKGRLARNWQAQASLALGKLVPCPWPAIDRKGRKRKSILIFFCKIEYSINKGLEHKDLHLAFVNSNLSARDQTQAQHLWTQALLLVKVCNRIGFI